MIKLTFGIEIDKIIMEKEKSSNLDRKNFSIVKWNIEKVPLLV
jgi:hypothetical protein